MRERKRGREKLINNMTDMKKNDRYFRSTQDIFERYAAIGRIADRGEPQNGNRRAAFGETSDSLVSLLAANVPYKNDVE